jgi:hypothetical protein
MEYWFSRRLHPAKAISWLVSRLQFGWLVLILLMITASALPSKAANTKTAPAQSKTHTTAQLWALACPALLTEINHARHDVLWCYNPPDAENVEEEKRALKKWWNVSSRSDLFATLAWIENGGHRAHWDDFRTAFFTGDVRELRERWGDEDSEIVRRMAIIRTYGRELGGKSLIGWDYCRYIALCRWGVLCSYISQEEAWKTIMPAARLLQRTFSSWSDLGQNYLIGREFWSLGATEDSGGEYRQNYQKLLTDKSSPWVRIPWKTDLNIGADAVVK